MNGALLEQLAYVSGHVDPTCVDIFRYGAPLIGVLPCTGIGVAVAVDENSCGTSVLRENCEESNAALASFVC